MGYYDQDYENRSSRRRGGFFPAIVGAVIGALLVFLAVPFLMEAGILPYGNQSENANGDKNGANDVPSQSVDVDVTTDITEAVSKVSDAVVGVVNIQQAGFWSDGMQEAGTGSGVIYKKENGKAFVVTNNHVVEGATQLEVSLSDGTKVPAKLLGTDIYTDLAVLEMDDEHVEKVATFGNSENLRLGEPVIAIGNPLGLEFSGSVTQGIVSGLERAIPVDFDEDGQEDWRAEVIQTDAAINPGNSGGALVNVAGQIVGINSMKIAREAVEGIGFSIPTTIVKPIISDLEKYGEVRRPYMGITPVPLSEVPSYHWKQTLKLPNNVTAGVVIYSIVPFGPADKAGLKELDTIVALDGEEIRDEVELRKYLYNEKKVGETVNVTYYRAGKKQTAEVSLLEQRE